MKGLRHCMVIPLILLALVHQAGGQVARSNPFEVKDRIENGGRAQNIEETAVVDTLDIENTTNPFEVNHVPVRKQQLRQQESPINKIVTAKPKVSNSFIFWIMIFSWAILAIVISNKTSLISYLVRSMFNLNMMKLTKRDEASGYNFHFGLLYLCFFINISVFLYLLQKHFSKLGGIRIWFYCFLGVVVVYAVRHLFMALLGKIFPVTKEASLFSYIILVFNILLGLFIIPLNLMLAYGPITFYMPVLYVGIGIIFLFYVLRNLRGLSLSLFLIGQGIVPFFIYLCTVEIAPLLVLIRAVSGLQGLQ